MTTNKYFKRITNKIKPHVQSFILTKNENDKQFHFKFKDEEYMLSLRNEKYIVLYRKMQKKEYLSKIDVESIFNPILNIENNDLSEFDAQKFLESAAYNTSKWLV